MDAKKDILEGLSDEERAALEGMRAAYKRPDNELNNAINEGNLDDEDKKALEEIRSSSLADELKKNIHKEAIKDEKDLGKNEQNALEEIRERFGKPR